MNRRHKTATWAVMTLLMVGILAIGATAAEVQEDPRDGRIRKLEADVRRLTDTVENLQLEGASRESRLSDTSSELEKIRDEFAVPADRGASTETGRLKFGGYGEMHANFSEASSSDVIDIHRLVLYLGYDFENWISLHSETEVEHAFISDDSGGELSIEQLYVDFLLSPYAGLRFGRILTPIGIVNSKHEPTTFNGVERPSFAKYIVPSTWSSDGAGIFGSAASWLGYQFYVVGGLDGSGFTAKEGIRKGRIKERASFNSPAVTGRLDFYPAVSTDEHPDRQLRLGLSSYFGGIDNGNNGADPGTGGDLLITSADFELSVGKADFRGVVAHGRIDGAGDIGGGVAEEIFGWYAEAGYHVWCDQWGTGRLKEADAIVFVRYDEFDTQYAMPAGVAPNPAFDRSEWTLGVSFLPTPNLVVKGDAQFRRSDAEKDMDTLFNLGLGWQY